MFFKKPAEGICKIIRTTDDEMPKNNESWAEFMVRKDKEDPASAKVGIIVACLILLPFIAYIAVDALDKAFK